MDIYLYVFFSELQKGHFEKRSSELGTVKTDLSCTLFLKYCSSNKINYSFVILLMVFHKSKTLLQVKLIFFFLNNLPGKKYDL